MMDGLKTGVERFQQHSSERLTHIKSPWRSHHMRQYEDFRLLQSRHLCQFL